MKRVPGLFLDVAEGRADAFLYDLHSVEQHHAQHAERTVLLRTPVSVEAYAVAGRPEDHILAAHCGFLGVVPQSFSTEWKLKPKVLAIVNENASAIDARLATGKVTLVKLMPPFDRWSIVEGELPKYAGFKNSHCLNGAVIRVPNGKRLVADLVSHHYILTTGHNFNELEMVSKVFDLDCITI